MEAFLKTWLESDEPEAPVLVREMPFDFAQGKPEFDVYILETETRTIEIKHVREMIANVSTTSFTGKRLVVIDEAEKLSVPASQALLKTLEEPSKTNRFMLVTRFPTRLLPTILSRVQRVHRDPSVSLREPPPLHKGRKGFDAAALLGKKGRKGLSEAELEGITKVLDGQMREAPGPGVQRALLRLRDYYKIRALRGNEKLAADVLLASLCELDRIEA